LILASPQKITLQAVSVNVCWLLHIWHLQVLVSANAGRNHSNTWLQEIFPDIYTYILCYRS